MRDCRATAGESDRCCGEELRGTAFSGARSGPAWQPTQTRCSPRLAQIQDFSASTVLAGSIQQIEADSAVRRGLTKKDPSLFDGRLAERHGGAGVVERPDADRRDACP